MIKLIVLLLGAAYLYGAYRFWVGFRRTNFNQGRLPLSLLWPILLLANRSYRKNFRKALKG